MNFVDPHDPMRAEDHNDLVDGVQSITPHEGPLPRPVAAFPHPWQCSVTASAVPGQWKVAMRAGWMNDVEAPVAYLSSGDPRGWVMPSNYPASRIQNGVASRSWREKTDPPCILLNQAADFAAVADAARPPLYQTADAWTKDLFMASVYLSARPWNLFSGKIITPAYRTWAGRLPTLPTYPYGIFELARIYLLVDPKDSSATTGVKQIEYWDMHCAPVDPVTVIPDYQPIGAGGIDSILGQDNLLGTLFTNQVNNALANMATTSSSVEAWSV